MTTAGMTTPARLERAPLVPNAVLGALIFVVVEVMFFAGILSALTISRAGAAPGTWGAASTSSLAGDVGIALLLASGASLFAAHRAQARSAEATRRLLLATIALGGVFVVLQAIHLSASGIAIASSQERGFVVLVSALHALHAAATLLALLVAWRRLGRGALTPSFFNAAQVFWYFVVLVWPVIYLRVHVG